MALAAVDAPQGCIYALIAVSPTLQREDRVSDWHRPASEQRPKKTPCYIPVALVHIWLALPTKVSYLNTFDSKSDYTPGLTPVLTTQVPGL